MISRRNFIKYTSGSTGLLLSGCYNKSFNSKSAHVVIIGGGYAGATAAKTIRMLDPMIKVTLIEPKTQYISCPGSNWVFAGLKAIDSLSFGYQNLSKHYGVKLIHDRVTDINPAKHLITLSNQQAIHYDRLIVSPGIDFKWDNIEGHDESSSHIIAHAWKAGTQTTLLNNQLKAMPDGGTVIICAPPNPFRCPPGPYERASMIAHYLKRHKPKSKILIIDPKSQFSKQALFIDGWERHYGYGTNNSMIKWLSVPDNPVIRVDVKNKIVETDFGDLFKADVLNYIPTQKAGYIAEITGLTNASGWCPIKHKTSESTLLSDIHVIGDAAIYSPLPKSAFAANSEAKMCAFAIVNLLNGTELIEPTWINTCYSLITENHGISINMVYKLDEQEKLIKVNGAGGVSKRLDKDSLALEAFYAKQWFDRISTDSFD
ncbi:MAG: FAD-dependent oxidoreductase [Methylococcales bacterium]|nr:FAD-dependent oxidoreductase [Methylococcales bacterium]